MEPNNNLYELPARRELVISRELQASPTQLWEVWTRPEHLKEWWGPNGFTNTIEEMDVKPGGHFDLTMHSPDGNHYHNKSIYRLVDQPRQLVYDHLTGTKFTATVTFDAQGDTTLVSWRMLFETIEVYEQTVQVFKADQGLQQNVDRLAAYVHHMKDSLSVF